ncbi:hypothetical protein LCGC14_0773520 [marine sediment metagenome]|uniref:methylated-DNA--[protein]-cysteine S-methyltransferase n=1 Tax=marine sediment metagenome TaxID=412755 RepID=A0A0F9PXS7_9ZZZZ
MIFSTIKSPLGYIQVAITSHGIASVSFSDSESAAMVALLKRYPHAEEQHENKDLRMILQQISDKISCPDTCFNFRLDIRGTHFQQQVWQSILTIPCGQTRSYSDVAVDIGYPLSARAVAMACAANTLALLIPCHRVVRRDGNLSGYRWGQERKRFLLQREQQYISNCS